jgi:hypothetical protein
MKNYQFELFQFRIEEVFYVFIFIIHHYEMLSHKKNLNFIFIC